METKARILEAWAAWEKNGPPSSDQLKAALPELVKQNEFQVRLTQQTLTAVGEASGKQAEQNAAHSTEIRELHAQINVLFSKVDSLQTGQQRLQTSGNVQEGIQAPTPMHVQQVHRSYDQSINLAPSSAVMATFQEPIPAKSLLTITLAMSEWTHGSGEGCSIRSIVMDKSACGQNRQCGNCGTCWRKCHKSWITRRKSLWHKHEVVRAQAASDAAVVETAQKMDLQRGKTTLAEYIKGLPAAPEKWWM